MAVPGLTGDLRFVRSFSCGFFLHKICKYRSSGVMTPQEELEQSVEGLVEMAKEEGFSLEEVQKVIKKVWNDEV